MATGEQFSTVAVARKHSYVSYMAEIYRNGATNQFPAVTTDPNKLQAQARNHLGERSYNYVAGGAGEKATMDANRLAFRQWKERSRLCKH